MSATTPVPEDVTTEVAYALLEMVVSTIILVDVQLAVFDSIAHETSTVLRQKLATIEGPRASLARSGFAVEDLREGRLGHVDLQHGRTFHDSNAITKPTVRFGFVGWAGEKI